MDDTKIVHVTQRDYFAASALRGLLACSTFEIGPALAAEAAVKYADALIAALQATSASESAK